MIYVVKCYSCEQEFQVKRGETGADMICPECGAVNNIRDVIERIEDDVKKVDSDMEAIKKFDMSMHPVCDNVEWQSEQSRRNEYIGKGIGLLVLLILFLLHKTGIIDFMALMEKLDNIFS